MNKERKKLIGILLKHIREFGYPHANAGNVITDMVYRKFCRPILANTADELPPGLMRDECRKMVAEIDALDTDDRIAANAKLAEKARRKR